MIKDISNLGLKATLKEPTSHMWLGTWGCRPAALEGTAQGLATFFSAQTIHKRCGTGVSVEHVHWLLFKHILKLGFIRLASINVSN